MPICSCEFKYRQVGRWWEGRLDTKNNWVKFGNLITCGYECKNRLCWQVLPRSRSVVGIHIIFNLNHSLTFNAFVVVNNTRFCFDLLTNNIIMFSSDSVCRLCGQSRGDHWATAASPILGSYRREHLFSGVLFLAGGFVWMMMLPCTTYFHFSSFIFLFKYILIAVDDFDISLFTRLSHMLKD